MTVNPLTLLSKSAASVSLLSFDAFLEPDSKERFAGTRSDYRDSIKDSRKRRKTKRALRGCAVMSCHQQRGAIIREEGAQRQC